MENYFDILESCTSNTVTLPHQIPRRMGALTPPQPTSLMPQAAPPMKGAKSPPQPTSLMPQADPPMKHAVETQQESLMVTPMSIDNAKAESNMNAEEKLDSNQNSPADESFTWDDDFPCEWDDDGIISIPTSSQNSNESPVSERSQLKMVDNTTPKEVDVKKMDEEINSPMVDKKPHQNKCAETSNNKSREGSNSSIISTISNNRLKESSNSSSSSSTISDNRLKDNSNSSNSSSSSSSTTSINKRQRVKRIRSSSSETENIEPVSRRLRKRSTTKENDPPKKGPSAPVTIIPLTKGTARIHAMKLVTTKEINTEQFLKEIVDTLPMDQTTSAVETTKMLADSTRQKLTDLSVTLSHKLNPLVSMLVERKMEEKVAKNYVKVRPPTNDIKATVEKYTSCFDNWVDSSDYVSFKATNTTLLGDITAKDMFILTFFIFATCQRTKNDNLLQLGLVGVSTSGKSTIFESVLMEGCHVTTAEQGVGRFNMGNKPVLMFHDVDIRTLAASKDTVKIKTLCRTEPTVAKIHGSTLNIGPVFVFYSSNRRLMQHSFERNNERANALKWRCYPAQVNEEGKRKVPIEDLTAIQNRFIECFVRSAPPLSEDLPNVGGFLRIHGVLGLMERVINIMAHYNKHQFHSPMAIIYVMHGLCNNASDYNLIMGNNSGKLVRQSIVSLLEKYFDDDEGQRKNLIETLFSSS